MDGKTGLIEADDGYARSGCIEGWGGGNVTRGIKTGG